MSDLHARNAQIAQSYDRIPYEAPAQEALDPAHVLGIGGVYGCGAGKGDVLDLGCGTGLTLARAAAQASGRLVGVDLSSGNCHAAQSRLGGRAEILAADFLDLTAQSLGRFDLIYAIGVLYVVPPEVKRHLIALIGQCLKPGGVAVISHYSGPAAAVRAHVHGLIRAAVAPGDPAVQLRDARAYSETLAARLDPNGLPLACLRQSMSLPDASFYHEVFNPWLASLQAAELDRAFSASGVGFLCRVDPGRHGALATPAARALECDFEDLSGGAYRYSLFGHGAGAPNLHAPGLTWTTALTIGPRPGDEFRHPSGNMLRASRPGTRAVLERLIAGAATLDTAPGDADLSQIDADLMNLWMARLIAPLRA